MRLLTISLVMRRDRKMKMQLNMTKKKEKKRKKKRVFLLKKILKTLTEME